MKNIKSFYFENNKYAYAMHSVTSNSHLGILKNNQEPKNLNVTYF